MNNKKTYLFALIPFLVLCILFELIPIIYTSVRSFVPEGKDIGFTFENYINIFSKTLYQKAIVNSLLISILSSIIGLIVAFIGAKAVHESKGKLNNIFMSILNMVSNFSGVPLAFAYIIMFGNVGVMTMIGSNYGIEFLANFPLYSVWGLLLIYVYFQIPLSTLLLIPAFDAIRKEWKESNALLGGTNFTFWTKIGIPILMPSILSTFSVLFANALAAYASAYALLMNNVSLLPIRLSEQFVGDLVQRPEFGSAIAVVLIVFMIIAIMIQNKLTVKKGI
ncbi:ABC transporter permease [Tyzzerella sp. An114]|uniref:ABC transporter permease n=1 Tax=Tyzzerella sp. An114 TaxID=1965545 RepID=UPI000B44AFC8|nr:ABC transporter permease subunit [Tyzzerella sp. An114]OUQ56787.1 ABC transporter permease [Tyzzerella sp. An114]HIT73572.1 ABC transporter permease subunit [Candidatus Fimicola cottocaccae]